VGAAGAPAAPPAAAPQADAAAVVHPSASTAPLAVSGGGWWRTVALVSLALWVLSVLAWMLWRRRSNKTAKAAPSPAAAQGSPSRLRAAFLVQARGSDAPGQAAALLAWAQAERPSLRNLGELAQALSAGPQREAIEALQRKRYAGADEPGLGSRLAAAFRDGFAWQPATGSADASPLPPLYPFSLRR